MILKCVVIESHLCLFIILSFLSSAIADRTVSLTINPGCGDLCNRSIAGSDSYVNLVHVKADSNNDTIHYVWSSIGSFSILIAKTALNSQLYVNWQKLLSDDLSSSVHFSLAPDYTTAAVFTNLWAYDDINDDADVAKARYDLTTKIPFRNLTWEAVRTLGFSDRHVRAEFVLSLDQGTAFGNRTLLLNLDAFGDSGHYDQLPKLLHTSSSFQLELVLNNFATSYAHTRFALEMAIFTDHSVENEYWLDKLSSIDDEYTPGVFTTVHITTSLNNSTNTGSYLLWKPMCYTSSDRTTEYSTDTKEKLGTVSLDSRLSEVNVSLVNAYYGSSLHDKVFTFINVSYGLQEDGFYQETNYLSWTATMGLGTPPSETFSALVIIVIVVGFGVPALLVLIGSAFIVIRRFRSKGDELVLNDGASKILT